MQSSSPSLVTTDEAVSTGISTEPFPERPNESGDVGLRFELSNRVQLEVPIKRDRPTLAVAYMPQLGEAYELAVECSEAGHALTFQSQGGDSVQQQWIGRIDHGTTGLSTVLRVTLRKLEDAAARLSARVTSNDHCTTLVCRDEDAGREAVATLILLTRQDAI